MKLSSLKMYLRHPTRLLVRIGKNSFLKRMSDEKYLKMLFKDSMGYPLDLENPKTFNEKLQWLKLYDRKPIYTTMVDKYEVKKYIAEKLGEEYVIPTLGVWDRFEDIDFEALPEQFVLKCTHDSGGLVICRDKKKLDIKAVKKSIDHCMGRNYFWSSREWPYKDIKPRIIAEQYMQDGERECLPVYKIFNFGGVPKIIQSIQDDKTSRETIDYFDTEWNHLDLKQNYPNSKTPLEKPEPLEKMLSLAAQLSQGFPFVRTDLYIINGEIYFSEYTFFSDSGLSKFYPSKWDSVLGGWICLPQENQTEPGES